MKVSIDVKGSLTETPTHGNRTSQLKESIDIGEAMEEAPIRGNKSSQESTNVGKAMVKVQIQELTW